jgi:hypothetical protein
LFFAMCAFSASATPFVERADGALRRRTLETVASAPYAKVELVQAFASGHFFDMGECVAVAAPLTRKCFLRTRLAFSQ